MWIEYDLTFNEGTEEVRAKGMFNSAHVKWIQVENHGYGDSIELYYDGYDSKSIFVAPDEDVLERVLLALQQALCGITSYVSGFGHIRPMQRPFEENKTLIPSSYEKPIC